MKRNFKILIIPEYLNSPSGGAREFFYKILEINRSCNFKTAVILEKCKADKNVKIKCNITNSVIFEIPNRVGKFKIPIYSMFYEIKYYYKIIHRFNPDVILVSNIRPGVNLSVLFFSYPIIFYIHSYPTSKIPFWHYYWTQIISRVFSNKKKQFVSVSNYAVEQVLKHMKVSKKHTDKIYNSFSSKIQFSQLKQNRKEIVVLTIGHVVSYKNPYVWLDVAESVIKKNSCVKFIWVGEGPLLESMRDLVNQRQLYENTIFNGYASDTNYFYTRAFLYFQPSLAESNGIAVIEAMRYGLPCVASNVGGLPESVINDHTGYTCGPNNIELFTEKIIFLIENPERAVTLGNAGKKRAMKLFCPLVQRNKIVNLYNKIIQ